MLSAEVSLRVVDEKSGLLNGTECCTISHQARKGERDTEHTEAE